MQAQGNFKTHARLPQDPQFEIVRRQISLRGSVGVTPPYRWGKSCKVPFPRAQRRATVSIEPGTSRFRVQRSNRCATDATTRPSEILPECTERGDSGIGCPHASGAGNPRGVTTSQVRRQHHRTQTPHIQHCSRADTTLSPDFTLLLSRVVLRDSRL
ncbi:hypothetical protein Bbelb_022910 [Branchiostoma belcheri]|nr:hypothetical protein Bbelb_022910 [Branchiostoma belcheri]